jgi:hypothetical protein
MFGTGGERIGTRRAKLGTRNASIAASSGTCRWVSVGSAELESEQGVLPFRNLARLDIVHGDQPLTLTLKFSPAKREPTTHGRTSTPN